MNITNEKFKLTEDMLLRKKQGYQFKINMIDELLSEFKSERVSNPERKSIQIKQKRKYKKKLKRVNWTPEDIQKVKDSLENDTSPKKLSKELKRSMYSIYHKALYKFDYKSLENFPPRWKKEFQKFHLKVHQKTKVKQAA